MKYLYTLAFFTFVLFQSKAQIVITEINYNTPGSVDSLDFIELYNNSSSAVNLNGWKFKKAITSTIGNITINPGSYKVFCYDSLAFYRNFSMSANQWRSNALSNSTDSIHLEDAGGTIIDRVYYTDAAPWPILADGEGPSLALCNPSLDNNIGSNWTYGASPTGIVIAGKEIYAHPGSGCPATDIMPPIPYSANETAVNTVQVYFNEAVNSSAENVANYSGLGTVTSAARNMTNDMVTLTLSTPLTIGTYYVLSVNGIQDMNGNTQTLARAFNIVFNNTLGTVAIDEVYYNDPFLNDTLEFVEIVNYGSSPVAIGGYRFNKGISIRIPQKTLAPNEYYVVAKDSLLIYRSYGVVSSKWSSGGLGNVAEVLILTNSLYQTVDSFSYDSTGLSSTNGTGASLVICPSYTDLKNYNDVQSRWTAEIPRSDNANSRVVGGRTTIVSPGRYNCETNNISDFVIEGLNIYPTLSNGLINIEHFEDAAIQIDIFDIHGKLIMQHQHVKQQESINIHTLESGMYLLVVYAKNKTQTFKIIKN